MKFSVLAASVAAAALVAGAASAASITVTKVTGSWIDTTPDNVTISNAVDNGTDISTLRWGTPYNGGPLSGYDFDAIAPGTLTISEENRSFKVADFTHHNFPIYAPSLTAAKLAVEIEFEIDGTSTTLSNVFNFAHNETPNVQNQCPDQTPACDDIVTVSGALSFGGELLVNGTEYFLMAEGFKATADGPILNRFQTIENQSNTAALWVSFRTEQEILEAIPLPAGVWLMLSGLGALGIARKRRKAA